jgi:hypothetical protein
MYFIMGTKGMMARGIPKYMRQRWIMERSSLNLCLNIKHDIYKHEVCKKKDEMKFYYDNVYKYNMKWKKQGHNAILYLKIMLNRLKVIKETTFTYNIAYIIGPNVIKLPN